MEKKVPFIACLAIGSAFIIGGVTLFYFGAMVIGGDVTYSIKK